MRLLARALITLFLVSVRVAAAHDVVVDDGFRELALGRFMTVGLDTTSGLKVEDVAAGKLPLEPSQESVPSRGLREGTFWGKVTIEDRRATPEPLVLEQRYAQSDIVVLHEEGEAPQRSGDHVAFATWPVHAREPAFVLPARAHHELFVELRGEMTKQLPLVLRSQVAYREHLAEDSLAQGLYFGSVFALVVYNLFLFVGTRQRVYGLYAVTVAAYLGSQLAIHGIGTQRLWGELPGLNDRLVMAFVFAFVAVATPFFREVLELDKRSARASRLFTVFTWTALVGLVCVPFIGYRLAVSVGVLFAVAWCPSVLVISLREAVKGDRVAVAVTLAWMSLLGGMFVYALRVVGVMPTNVFTVYATQVGSVLEALLLSFALADRIKSLQGEVVSKGELALANARVALENADRARAASEEALAAREVAMRELEERRRVQGELDVATQQLTQAENMATLGMLMAGIAHDLRNPLNYVQGAVEQLREAVPSLREAEGENRAKTVDRVEKVVGWVEQGAASMDAISLAMRNQARGGGEGFEAVALREVVSEALLLCRSRTKLCEVEVAVEDVTVHADPTGLGQLVMNLVSNAADALAEAWEKAPTMRRCIRVSASGEGSRYSIAVEDSGKGVPEALRSKILEPFFTTKPRGQGTGLGLAIVQRVVRQHGGMLEIGTSATLGGACFRFAAEVT